MSRERKQVESLATPPEVVRELALSAWLEIEKRGHHKQLFDSIHSPIKKTSITALYAALEQVKKTLIGMDYIKGYLVHPAVMNQIMTDFLQTAYSNYYFILLAKPEFIETFFKAGASANAASGESFPLLFAIIQDMNEQQVNLETQKKLVQLFFKNGFDAYAFPYNVLAWAVDKVGVDSPVVIVIVDAIIESSPKVPRENFVKFCDGICDSKQRVNIKHFPRLLDLYCTIRQKYEYFEQLVVNALLCAQSAQKNFPDGHFETIVRPLQLCHQIYFSDEVKRDDVKVAEIMKVLPDSVNNILARLEDLCNTAPKRLLFFSAPSAADEYTKFKKANHAEIELIGMNLSGAARLSL